MEITRKNNELKLTKKFSDWLAIRDNLEMLLAKVILDKKSAYWLSRTYDRIEPMVNKKLKEIIEEAATSSKFKELRDLFGDKKLEELEESDRKLMEEAYSRYQKSFAELIESEDNVVELFVFVIDISDFIKNNLTLTSFHGKYFSILKDIIAGEPDEEALKLL